MSKVICKVLDLRLDFSLIFCGLVVTILPLKSDGEGMFLLEWK